MHQFSQTKTYEFLGPCFSLSAVAFEGFESVSKILDVFRSSDYDSHLFSSQMVNIKRYRDISDPVVKDHKRL